MSNIELFLKHFDRIHRKISHAKPGEDFKYERFMTALRKLNGKNRVISENYRELIDFADFRNLDAHTNHLAPNFAEPHDNIVRKIEEIANKLDPQAKAIDYAIKSDRIYSANLDANAKNVIRSMIENMFTHVPILDEAGKMVGVFSESSLFNYFGQNDEIILDGAVSVAEFEDFIHIDGRDNEVFRFVPRGETLAAVKSMFVDVQLGRLGAIFITENGSQAESLLGLITAWDVIPH